MREPWLEEAEYTLRKDQEEQEWRETLPTCTACGEPLRDWVYDFSEGHMEEGYVFCEDCVDSYFNDNSGDLNEAIRAGVFDKFRRKI